MFVLRPNKDDESRGLLLAAGCKYKIDDGPKGKVLVFENCPALIEKAGRMEFIFKEGKLSLNGGKAARPFQDDKEGLELKGEWQRPTTNPTYVESIEIGEGSSLSLNVFFKK